MTTWFYASLNNGTAFVAIEARDEAHAARRATKGGYTVDGIKPITRELWAYVQQQFPLPQKPVTR